MKVRRPAQPWGVGGAVPDSAAGDGGAERAQPGGDGGAGQAGCAQRGRVRAGGGSPARRLESPPRRPRAGEQVLGAAGTGSESPGPRLARSPSGGRSPARPPPPRPVGSASPSTSRVLPARAPAQSAALGPGEPGSLSGRRRLSATLASRGARRLGTSAPPGSPLRAVPPPPLLCRGGAPARAARAAILLLFLPEGKEQESREAAPGEREPRPPAPEARGWRRRRRRRREVRVTPGRRVSPPGSGCGCQLPTSGSGGGGGRRRGARGLTGHGEETRARGRQELCSVALDCGVGT